MTEIEKLLNNVYLEIRDYENRKDIHEESYNIFQVLEVSEKEMIMCRMLADLLNPEGRHGCGTKYLCSFVEQVLHIQDIGETFYKNAKVIKEYGIPESKSGRSSRRIDIVIQSTKCFIPIEVKIWAEDQEAQCYDYYQLALEKMGESARVYYLTTDGTSPSEYSTGMETDNGEVVDRVPGDGIVNISFKKDICAWLRNVITAEVDGRIKDTIAQYLDAIEDMTGAIGYEEGLLVEGQLLKTSSAFEAGLWIEETMEQAKIKLISTLMNDIRMEMRPLLEKYGLKELGPKSYYSMEQQAGRYYKQNDSTYPGINYLVERAVFDDGKEMWLRVEIDWNLFAGFCLFDPSANGGRGCQVDEMEEWKDDISDLFKDMPEVENDDWWILWCYLPSGNHGLGNQEKRCPEFKSFNKAAIELVDDEHRKAMVEEYVGIIETVLLSRLK